MIAKVISKIKFVTWLNIFQKTGPREVYGTNDSQHPISIIRDPVKWESDVLEGESGSGGFTKASTSSLSSTRAKSWKESMNCWLGIIIPRKM